MTRRNRNILTGCIVVITIITILDWEFFAVYLILLAPAIAIALIAGLIVGVFFLIFKNKK